jgi:hypothetical protein
MSTPASPAPPAPPAGRPAPSPNDAEIRIISHSNLFYWWPVWAVGLIMALLTWIDGHRMMLVPEDANVSRTHRVEIAKDQFETREGIILPKDKHLLPEPKGNDIPPPADPKLHMSKSKSYGVIFEIILLLVIVITNVPLRGLWSVVVIVIVVMLTIIFALAGWWEDIFTYLDRLHIQINMAGYLFISLVLLAIWLVTLFFFDQQIYMVFTPGQLKVRTEIGGGEKAYDTSGMTIEKQRSDLFRHWILGLGSGDLIVNTSGAAVHHFDLPNVLFLNKKVTLIEDMLREKAVVRGRS